MTKRKRIRQSAAPLETTEFRPDYDAATTMATDAVLRGEVDWVDKPPCQLERGPDFIGGYACKTAMRNGTVCERNPPIIVDDVHEPGSTEFNLTLYCSNDGPFKGTATGEIPGEYVTFTHR